MRCPALQLLKAGPISTQSVSVLVLSPTRELAQQIQAETHKLLTFHNNIMCQVSSGGGGAAQQRKKNWGRNGAEGGKARWWWRRVG